MPDDRLFHRALGQSEKVNDLTDFEKTVWWAYKLAADDFGVMRHSATPLQNLARWLDRKPSKVVFRALERILEIGLVQSFEHQKQIYVYQADWQTWQKITHPRQTKQPAPPLEALDRNTLWLFSHHPKGGKLPSWQHPDERKKTGSEPGIDTKETGSVAV